MYAFPVMGFGLAMYFLGLALGLDPRRIPSPLIGKSVSTFALPPVQGRSAGLASTDLVGSVSIVNVFASWCVACREEHPVLVDLARGGVVAIYGLNYKDKPEDAARWLDEWGDPYSRTGSDLDGRVAIDWEVYGVPETFLVNSEGRIVYKHTGLMTQAFIEGELLPRIRRLESQGGGRLNSTGVH